MGFILGALFGASAIAIAVMLSLAKAAKESDEIESELFAQKVEKIKAKRHENSEDEQG